MIDVHTEQLLTLNQARAHPAFRTAGRAASLEKLYRIASRGARDIKGNHLRLEIVKLPGGLATSREAIARFISRLTDPDAPIPAPKKRRALIDRAEAELEAAGFEIGEAA